MPEPVSSNGDPRTGSEAVTSLPADRDARTQTNGPPLEGGSFVVQGLALEWLSSIPGYRELIRERVSDARKRARRADDRIARVHEDRDYLGHESEGCG
jgi:hypothetical protein